jgi:hypothetical protein
MDNVSKITLITERQLSYNYRESHLAFAERFEIEFSNTRRLASIICYGRSGGTNPRIIYFGNWISNQHQYQENDIVVRNDTGGESRAYVKIDYFAPANRA